MHIMWMEQKLFGLRNLGIFFVLLLFGCSGSDSDSNSGWIKITDPTTEEVYELPDYQEVLEIGGEAFPVAATTRTQCFCFDPTYITCLFFPVIYCNDYVIDNGARISITNTTMDTAGFVEAHGENWRSVTPLTIGENIIHVRAEDDNGNFGIDTLKVIANDTSPPTVISKSPDNNSVVYVTSDIWVTFSEAMDTSTITTSNFSIDDGINNISGTISFYNENKSAKFTPSVNFAYDTTYTVSLNSLIQDLSNNKLTATTWSFLTFVEAWQFGSAGHDEGRGIAIDTNRNSYVTGITNGDLTGAGNAGEYDSFIAKYDTSGNQLWTKQFGTAGNDGGHGIAVDKNGNSYVTGHTGGEPFIAGSYNIFLSKYDTYGNELWTRQPSTIASNDFAHGIALDDYGNSYITGRTDGDLANTGNAGSYDVIIMKYNTSGTQLWVRQFGSNTYDLGTSVTVDINGNSYFSGYTSGDIAGTGNAGGNDAFIAKYDTSGNKLWVRQFGSDSQDQGNSVTVDINGNSYISGHTSGDIAGTGNAGGDDAFIAKYSTSGNQLWTKQFGTEYDDGGFGIAVDVNGNSYTTGRTLGFLDGTGHHGNYDLFIVNYDTSGNRLWTEQFDSSSYDQGNDITVDADGTSYITGRTYGDFVGTGNIGDYDAFIMRYHP